MSDYKHPTQNEQACLQGNHRRDGEKTAEQAETEEFLLDGL